MDIKKIGNFTTQDVQYTDTTRRSSDEKSAARESGSPDTVRLSGRYQEMAKVQKVLMEREDVRPEEVDRYRRQIADGTYQVKADQVAQAMMQEIM